MTFFGRPSIIETAVSRATIVIIQFWLKLPIIDIECRSRSAVEVKSAKFVRYIDQVSPESVLPASENLDLVVKQGVDSADFSADLVAIGCSIVSLALRTL